MMPNDPPFSPFTTEVRPWKRYETDFVDPREFEEEREEGNSLYLQLVRRSFLQRVDSSGSDKIYEVVLVYRNLMHIEVSLKPTGVTEGAEAIFELVDEVAKNHNLLNTDIVMRQLVCDDWNMIMITRRNLYGQDLSRGRAWHKTMTYLEVEQMARELGFLIRFPKHKGW